MNSYGKKSLSLLIVGIMTFFSLALLGFLSKGGGFNQVTKDIYAAKKRSSENCHNSDDYNELKICNFINNPNTKQIDVMLIGDSHAAGFTDSLVLLGSRKQLNISISTKSTCPSLTFNLKRDNKFINCLQFADFIREQINLKSPKLILLGFRGTNYINSVYRTAGEPRNTDKMCLVDSSSFEACGSSHQVINIFSKSLSDFISYTPASTKIILITGQPEFKKEFEHCARLFTIELECFDLDLNFYKNRNKDILSLLSSAKFAKVQQVNIGSFFCNRNGCSAFKEGKNLFYDSHHLNLVGNQQVFDKFISTEIHKVLR